MRVKEQSFFKDKKILVDLEYVPHILGIEEVLQEDLRFICCERIYGDTLLAYLIRTKGKWPHALKPKQKWEFGAYVNGKLLTNLTHGCKIFEDIIFNRCLEECLHSIIKEEDEWIALRGSVVAPGLGNNHYDLERSEFYVTDLVKAGESVPCTIGELTLRQTCIKWAPAIGIIQTPLQYDELLKYARGLSKLNPAIPRWGIDCNNPTKGIRFYV